MLESVQSAAPSSRPASGTSMAGTRLASTFLSGDERLALEAMAGPVRAVKASTQLVREGGTSEQLFMITEGWACRYRTARGGSRQIVALMVAGDVANLDALMFGRADYGVRILSASKIVALSCDRVQALAEQHAGIAKTLTRLAMVENTILSQWALCLGRQSAQQRLAHLFCELAVRLNGDEPEASSFDMPLTQEQLADALGLTSVHVNRTMQQLRAEGLIATSNRIITIPDVGRLRQVAGFDPAYLHLGAFEKNVWGNRRGGHGASRAADVIL